MKTFSDLLRRWKTAGDLVAAFAGQGFEISEVLVRRWWNEEMLPERCWRSFVAAAKAAGHKDITLELLAEIAETDRQDRLKYWVDQRAAATSQPAA